MNEELLMATIEAQDQTLQQLELRAEQLENALNSGLTKEGQRAARRLEQAAEQLRTILHLTKPTASDHAGVLLAAAELLLRQCSLLLAWCCLILLA